MTEQWLSLDAAVKLIRSDRKVSVGGAIQFLIDACAGGVRARQRPLYEKYDWGPVIPAAAWRGAHLDLDTGELFPAGTDHFDPPTEYGGYGDGGSGIIEVAEDDLRDYLRKLPEEAHEHKEVRGAGAWTVEATQMNRKLPEEAHEHKEVRGAGAWTVEARQMNRKLPEEAHEHKEVRGAGAWIAAEARRMKKAAEIPQDIKITDFAKELERRMCKAANVDRSPRPIKWQSIRNKLGDWGLWPITSIK